MAVRSTRQSWPPLCDGHLPSNIEAPFFFLSRQPVLFLVREIKSKKVPEMLGRFAETILFFYL